MGSGSTSLWPGWVECPAFRAQPTEAHFLRSPAAFPDITSRKPATSRPVATEEPAYGIHKLFSHFPLPTGSPRSSQGQGSAWLWPATHGITRAPRTGHSRERCTLYQFTTGRLIPTRHFLSRLREIKLDAFLQLLTRLRNDAHVVILSAYKPCAGIRHMVIPSLLGWIAAVVPWPC